MRALTILVSASGAPGTAALLRALRENGEREVRLVGTDMSTQAVGRHLCDSFHVVPAGSAPDFADAMLEVCEREGVDAVLPQSSFDLEGLAGAKGRFGAAVLVASPNEGTPLATPSHWEESVGWIANLMEVFPENPFTTGAEFVSEAIVWLASHLGGDLPGLRAMDAAGDLVANAARDRSGGAPRRRAAGRDPHPDGGDLGRGRRRRAARVCRGPAARDRKRHPARHRRRRAPRR